MLGGFSRETFGWFLHRQPLTRQHNDGNCEKQHHSEHGDHNGHLSVFGASEAEILGQTTWERHEEHPTFSQLSHFPHECLQQLPTLPQNTLEAPSSTQALSRGHPSAVIGFQGLLRPTSLHHLCAALHHGMDTIPQTLSLHFLTPLPPVPLTISVFPNTLSHILKHPHKQRLTGPSLCSLLQQLHHSSGVFTYANKANSNSLRSGEWERPDLGYFPPRTVGHHCSFTRFTFATGRKTQFQL